MAAPSETYVDPSIAADSGTGTSGDPYGDLQYALDTMTRDSTNGDRINIKTGTDEVLSAALDLTTYGTPTAAAPLIIQGYTSAAADGGIGGIDCNSGSLFTVATYDHIRLVDLKIHNGGSSTIINLDRYCVIHGCEIHNTTGAGIDTGAYSRIFRNHVHNCGGRGIDASDGEVVAFNFLKNGTNDFSVAIYCTGQILVFFNIISIDGASDGINTTTNQGGVIMNNSIYSNGGTGAGIQNRFGGNADHPAIIGNIIEGFSGTGGTAIKADEDHPAIGGNAFYNNATNINNTIQNLLLANQSLGSSPFADAANDDFTVDTSVKALSFPTANYNGLSVRSYLDIGALQRQEAGGGGTTGKQGLHPIESGSV